MAKSISLTILGIVAVIAIVGLVLLFTGAKTGKLYGVAGQEGFVQFPQTIATEYCATISVDLSVDKELCQAEGYELCEILQPQPAYPSIAGRDCVKECKRDVRNQCQVARTRVQSAPYVQEGLRYREV